MTRFDARRAADLARRVAVEIWEPEYLPYRAMAPEQEALPVGSEE